MSKTKSSLNGSVDTLAKAMRQVFTEAVQGAVEPLRGDVKAMEGRLNERIDDTNSRIDAVQTNIMGRIDQHQAALDGIKNKKPSKKKPGPRARAAR